MQEDDNASVGADAGEQLQPMMTPPTEQTEAVQTDPPAIDQPMEPVQAAERIHAIDVLRGFAIFGIFMVNIAFFAMPLNAAMPMGLAEKATDERIVWAIVKIFFEYKFVSTFSMLFGIGLIIQMQRAAQRGRPFAGMYLRRLFVLMFLGLCHGLLLWYGDILFIYSFVGILLFLLRGLGPRLMLGLAAGAMGLAILLIAANMSLAVWMTKAADETPPQGENQTAIVDALDPSAAETADNGQDDSTEPASEADVDDEPERSFARFWSKLETGMQQGPAGWEEAETIAYKEGPMTATLVMRSFEFLGMLIFAGILGGFAPRVVAMFLIGAAMMKLGFFKPQNRRWHVRFCVWGLALGLPGEFAVIGIYHATGYGINWGMATAEVWHQIASLALCLGYVGAITLVVNAGLLKWLTYAMSCVGRTALSNYLLQTIVATYIMYWWGFGLFNEFTRPQQLLLVVGVYASQLVLSVLYLRVFRIGPFEWLWRSLTYWKAQPIIR